MKRYILGLATVALTGCTDQGLGPTDQPSTNVQVSFATTSASAAAPLYSDAPFLMFDTIISGVDTLVLDTAQVVLGEIELKRMDVAGCPEDSELDGCEEFEAGPFLVNLPIGDSVQSTFALDVPVGVYNELELEIHKISTSDEDDAAFRNLHPEFAGLSIRVVGTFNGQPFVFTSDLDVEQELALTPVLVIEEGSGPTNITILVGLDDWFRDNAGNLLDPATGLKGGVNESVINENIENAIEAFEDDDRDGSRS